MCGCYGSGAEDRYWSQRTSDYTDSLDRKGQVNEEDDVMTKEMAIGKRRMYKGKEYMCMKALERALDTCEGCSFNVTDDGEHWRCVLHEGSELGPCIGDERTDGNDVYFAETREAAIARWNER